MSPRSIAHARGDESGSAHEVELVVQIVNYETKRYLTRCLTSVVRALDGSPLTSRVLVLNNGSTDDLSDIERRYSGIVDFYASDENLGFGTGHNLLATKANSAFLCCVNPDVVVTQGDAFERLLAHFADDSVAVTGPMLRTESARPQHWDHGELSGIRARVANGAGHAHWRPRYERIEAAWVSGAFLVARRSAFEAVGGFDEHYFLYKEEEDLCLQIRRNNRKVIYDPTVEAMHTGGVIARRSKEYHAASLQYYMTKNFSRQWLRRLLEAILLHVTRRLGAHWHSPWGMLGAWLNQRLRKLAHLPSRASGGQTGTPHEADFYVTSFRWGDRLVGGTGIRVVRLPPGTPGAGYCLAPGESHEVTVCRFRSGIVDREQVVKFVNADGRLYKNGRVVLWRGRRRRQWFV
jgi:GT2 family glycosyltransferase